MKKLLDKTLQPFKRSGGYCILGVFKPLDYLVVIHDQTRGRGGAYDFAHHIIIDPILTHYTLHVSHHQQVEPESLIHKIAIDACNDTINWIGDEETSIVQSSYTHGVPAL